MTRKPAAVVACSVLLFGLNAFICRELFTSTYIDAFGSVEGSFIALSRWIIENPRDVLWCPYWFAGMPWNTIYQPGFHVSTAGLASLWHVEPALAYHFLNGLFYCLLPVTVFWMCRGLTGRTAYAFLVGLVLSTFSPCIVFAVAFHDVGSPFNARRLQSITDYGEGPHVAVLALLPLVVLFFDKAFRRRSRLGLVLASFTLAACLLTNWPGMVGVAMALGSYLLAYGNRKGSWSFPLAIGALAYGLACPWMPPSTLGKVVFAAQHANGSYPFSGRHVVFLAIFLPALAGLVWIFQRTKTPEFLRFMIYFALFPAVIFVVWSSWNFSILPQPYRWVLEFEVAFTGATLFAVAEATRRAKRLHGALVAITLVFCIWQVRTYRVYVRYKVAPVEVRDRPEYKIAKWFDAHMQGRRVFAPGAISLWMNAFTDTPQFAGCCDQGLTNLQFRSALHTIYTGENAGVNDGSNSVLWLKSFGVQAIAVTGPGSTEHFHPILNPRKFDAILPLLWRDRDDSIYGLPQRTASLAHVMYQSSLVLRAPAHGLDTAPLLPYVAALDDPSLPSADFAWTSRHSAQIRATLAPGQVISVQESYEPGWHASIQGAPVRVFSDALGMMVIEPLRAGACAIDLVYRRSTEEKIARVISISCFMALLLIAGSAAAVRFGAQLRVTLVSWISLHCF